MTWDEFFIGLAEYVSKKSKDPSTKCGAVVVTPKHRVAGLGYNGFAQGVEDAPHRLSDRSIKYPLILHAEDNALAFSSMTEGCTLYVWPLAPCAACMSRIIQHGITRVVAPEEIPERWKESILLGLNIAREAGVVVDLV